MIGIDLELARLVVAASLREDVESVRLWGSLGGATGFAPFAPGSCAQIRATSRAAHHCVTSLLAATRLPPPVHVDSCPGSGVSQKLRCAS